MSKTTTKCERYSRFIDLLILFFKRLILFLQSVTVWMRVSTWPPSRDSKRSLFDIGVPNCFVGVGSGLTERLTLKSLNFVPLNSTVNYIDISLRRFLLDSAASLMISGISEFFLIVLFASYLWILLFFSFSSRSKGLNDRSNFTNCCFFSFFIT